jgi:formate-dependent nitrite reductase cytochrome c552 subunit
MGTSEDTILDCGECHYDKEELNLGEHGIEGFICTDCHTLHPTESIEVYTWEKGISIEDLVDLCEQCHLQTFEQF